MRTVDFSPLYRSAVGFDRLAGLLEAASAGEHEQQQGGEAGDANRGRGGEPVVSADLHAVRVFGPQGGVDELDGHLPPQDLVDGPVHPGHAAPAPGLGQLIAVADHGGQGDIQAVGRPHPGGRRQRALRLAYGAVAVGIILTLVLLAVGIVTGAGRGGFPVVLVGESVALALVGVFWVVQTVELWNEPDPGLRE